MTGDQFRRSAIALLCCGGVGAASVATAATPDSSAPPGATSADNLPVRPAPPPPPVAYTCADGTKVTARFPDSIIAMLIVGDDRYELTAGPAASGVRYTGGQVEFWTHQGKARFTRQGKETECQEAAPPVTRGAPNSPTEPVK